MTLSCRAHYSSIYNEGKSYHLITIIHFRFEFFQLAIAAKRIRISGVVVVSDMMNNQTSELIFTANNSSELEQIDDCPWLEDYRSRYSPLIERWKVCGFFRDRDLEDINCYWLQFEPAPMLNHAVLAVLYSLMLLTGCLANAITVYILASSRYLRTPANIIIMNLAVSDFFMLIKLPIFIYNSVLQGPALGSRGCQVYGFLSGLTGTTSIMSLAAVSVDRYLVIIHPLNHGKKPTRSRAYVIVTLIWLYSATFASLPLLGVGQYVPEGYLTSCSFDYLSDDITTRLFILAFVVAAWLVPFGIITGCYVAIVCYVRHTRLELDRQSWNRNPINPLPKPKKNSTGWRQSTADLLIAKIVVGLVCLWMISWTPYALVALMGISGYQQELTPGITMVPALFAKLSACINPIVYSLSHPKIKKEMLRRWCCPLSPANSTPCNPGGPAEAGAGIIYGTAPAAPATISPRRHQLGPVWRQCSSNSGSAVCQPSAGLFKRDYQSEN